MFCKIFTHCRLLEVESETPSIVSESLWPHGLGSASSSVHGILPARILEWVNVPFSRGSSQLRDQTQVSVIVGAFFTSWATREATSGRLKCGNSLEYHKSTSVSSYSRFWSKIHNEYFSIFFFFFFSHYCILVLPGCLSISLLGKIIELSLERILCVLYLNVFRWFEATCLQRCEISTLSSCTLSMPIGSGKRSNLVSVKEIWDDWWIFGRRKACYIF